MFVCFQKGAKAIKKSKPIPRYQSNLWIPLSTLFGVFSLNLSEAVSVGLYGETDFLFAVEDFTRWQMARCTKHDTFHIVRPFEIKNHLYSCGSAFYNIGYRRCLIAVALHDLTKTE